MRLANEVHHGSAACPLRDRCPQRNLIRASFIPPAGIRALRDLTRHRKSLQRDRVKTINRIHKLFETANIKLATVVSDIGGVSGRAMLRALAQGETDSEGLAALGRGSLKGKKPQLAQALSERFTSHHAFLLTQLLAQLDHLAVLGCEQPWARSRTRSRSAHGAAS